jgi:hypothetical protein
MKLVNIMLWLANFAVDVVILFLMVGFVIPFMIICWCFYHPALAKIYATYGMYALATTDWVTRSVLIVMALLAMLCFKVTHNFAKYTLKTAVAVGILCYIIACF